MLFRSRLVITCGLLLSACGGAGAGVSTLRTRYGSFDPQALSLPQLLDSQGADSARSFRLVQFSGPIQASWRQALSARGVIVQGYVPDNALRVLASSSAAAALTDLPYVRAVVNEPTLMKVDPRLVISTNDGFRIAATLGSRDVLLEMTSPQAASDVASLVQSLGGQVVGLDLNRAVEPTGVLHVRIAAAQLSTLASNADVRAIEPYQALHIMNDVAYGIIQSEVVHDSPLWNAGLRGEGQTVGICDVGVSTDSCFFPAGKITQYENVTPVVAHDTSHGTHTAGSIAGDNYGNGTYDLYDGMAPAASLYVQDAGTANTGEMNVPDDLTQLFTTPYAAGARIHSDSWGGDQNTYGARERSLDAFVFAHPDFLVIVAAGNTGGAVGTVNAPATAKNIIAAGALNGASPEDVASFSSQGPTADGRIKPTLMAPGVQVTSASAATQCGVESKDGTSMAAPMLAGGAALVRQYFTDGFYPSGVATPANVLTPSAALVKAVMLVGADGMTGQNTAGAVPNNNQGFGRVHLAAGLHLQGDGQTLWINDDHTGIDQQGDSTTTLQLQAGGALHVALTWMDAPGTAGAAAELVNDLDLVVTGPDGSTYVGNALAQGTSVTGGQADSINVEEIVYLPKAAAGVYTVQVRGNNVPMGPQPFAVVAVGSIASSSTTSDYLGIAPASSAAAAQGIVSNGKGSSSGCSSVEASWPFLGLALAALMWPRRQRLIRKS